jgi:Na+/proline symporter
MFAAFLAALMSSVDSHLNSASTLRTQDILGRLKEWSGGRPLDERTSLVLGRVLSAVLLVSAAVVAPAIERRFSNIYNAIQSMFSLIQGPTLAILLLGLLWRRATQWGALVGLVAGVGLCVVLNLESMAGLFPSEEPFLFVAWWSFVFTLAVTALTSLLTPADPPEKIRGLVWGDVLDDEEIQAALRRRVDE